MIVVGSKNRSNSKRLREIGDEGVLAMIDREEFFNYIYSNPVVR